MTDGRGDDLRTRMSAAHEMSREAATARVKLHEFEEAVREADAAGMAAAEACTPTPMIVAGRGSGLRTQYWHVPEGVCGFAWVTVRPGTSSFARWARKNGWDKAYRGGIQLWVGMFGQSYERKLAYARAYAGVLQQKLGIDAVASGALD